MRSAKSARQPTDYANGILGQTGEFEFFTPIDVMCNYRAEKSRKKAALQGRLFAKRVRELFALAAVLDRELFADTRRFAGARAQ
ncbi:MAG: hypothetical protein ABI190_07615, partial [Casimicrobiaceae bacterium]